jgi:hypothetical protein
MALLAALFLTQASCRAKPSRAPVFPVRGKVFYRGQPAAGALVFFLPLHDALADKPHGKVDAAGAFEISTYRLNDGAPPGEYAVTILWPGPNPHSNGEGDEDNQGPDQLGGRYTSGTNSTWHVKVAEQPIELDPFELE